MTPEPVILVQGAGPDSITVERAPRAGEYGWKVTAYGVDADHTKAKASSMVAHAENLVRTAQQHEAEMRGAQPAAPPASRRSPPRAPAPPAEDQPRDDPAQS